MSFVLPPTEGLFQSLNKVNKAHGFQVVISCLDNLNLDGHSLLLNLYPKEIATNSD